MFFICEKHKISDVPLINAKIWLDIDCVSGFEITEIDGFFDILIMTNYGTVHPFCCEKDERVANFVVELLKRERFNQSFSSHPNIDEISIYSYIEKINEFKVENGIN